METPHRPSHPALPARGKGISRRRKKPFLGHYTPHFSRQGAAGGTPGRREERGAHRYLGAKVPGSGGTGRGRIRGGGGDTGKLLTFTRKAVSTGRFSRPPLQGARARCAENPDRAIRPTTSAGGSVLKLESGGQHFRRGGSRTARQRRGMPCHRGFPQGGGIPRRRFFCPGEKPGRISPGPFASLRSPAERRESQAINRGRSPLWEGRTLLPLPDVGEAA